MRPVVSTAQSMIHVTSVALLRNSLMHLLMTLFADSVDKSSYTASVDDSWLLFHTFSLLLFLRCLPATWLTVVAISARLSSVFKGPAAGVVERIWRVIIRSLLDAFVAPCCISSLCSFRVALFNTWIFWWHPFIVFVIRDTFTFSTWLFNMLLSLFIGWVQLNSWWDQTWFGSIFWISY